MKNNAKKTAFRMQLKDFAKTLTGFIAKDDKWTIRGFIDIFKNIYTISSDTKIVSKALELHLFPHFLSFAESIGYNIELATFQNWYPDFCNGFTLGSHGEYFINRTCTKNIQYPCDDYSGHFCLGIIYSRAILDKNEETHIYSIDEIESMPAVIKNFLFFAEEKWKIASDKGGSGNTANIGSIQKIEDILSGNGVFAKAGEE